MAKPLEIRHTSPIEREFESWIVWGIEQYFQSIGVKYELFAVSPSEESAWPADQALSFNGKLVGLQMKQAVLATGPVAFDRLKWTFHSPKGQFEMVKAISEIHYCLPTFVNRDLRFQALHHCLFWRPGTSDDKNAWYDNCGVRTQTPYCRLKPEQRWGLFLEQIMGCKAGRVVTSAADINAVLDNIRSTLYEILDLWNLESDDQRRETLASRYESGGLYFLLIENL